MKSGLNGNARPLLEELLLDELELLLEELECPDELLLDELLLEELLRPLEELLLEELECPDVLLLEELLLDELEELLVPAPPPVTESDVMAGRPLPVPQKPNDAEPLTGIA
jgi:hypothetical protein